MSRIPPVPPLDNGLMVLPGFVDFQAQNNPEMPFAIWPRQDAHGGIQSVSYLQFAQATHRIAHALRPNREGEEGQVVAILIHTDALLYMAIIAGCCRAGLVPFPMSPRNSAAAVCSMLQKTSAHRIIVDSGRHGLLAEIQAELKPKAYDLQVQEMPSLQCSFPVLDTEGFNDAAEVGPYPHKHIAQDDLCCYLHSSGSTGFPKPIPLKHQFLLNICRMPVLLGSRERQVQFAAMTIPTFHIFAFVFQFMMPLFSSKAVGLYPPMHPEPPVVPNPQSALEASRITGCTGMPSVPTFIEVWARSEEDTKYLASLQILTYAGAPLSKKSGDALVAAGVTLIQLFGGTEIGCPVLAFHSKDPIDEDLRTPEDWQWLQFSNICKPRWIPQGDGTYELQFLTCDTHQPSVENISDVTGYATSDLFEPHPTKKGLWRVCGRIDDVIVLKSAEKIVPIQQEALITSNSMVKGAVMFGRGRDEAGVIIDPVPEYAFDPKDESLLIAFRNKIWPTVDEANRIAPAFARIFKEMILVTDPSRPLPYAHKGTVLRKPALTLYEPDIERLYETVQENTSVTNIPLPAVWDVPTVEKWLLQHATMVNDNVPPLPDVDLFQQGFDSLSATFLRSRIIGALRASSHNNAAVQVSQNLVFDHPTIRRLAQTITALANSTAIATEPENIMQQVKDLIDKYSSNLPVVKPSDIPPAGGIVVLLTGSTGNIGSHFLAGLLADDRIAKVYTIDRPSTHLTPVERQTVAFKERDLPIHLLSKPELVSLAGDLNGDSFGLEKALYEELEGSVTHIIHNAWAVNFNLPLHSFESHISGTRNLLDLISRSSRSVKLLFTSSAGAVQGWDLSKGPVPETPLPESDVSLSIGYGASKYVVEHIFENAQMNGFEVTSLRIGQVSGSSETGSWNQHDWIPSMIKSGLAFGTLPEVPGPVDWLPMDAVTRMMLDLIFAKEKLPSVLNVVHPHSITWQEVFRALNDNFGGELQLVSLTGWVAELERKSLLASPEMAENIPAMKLLSYFQSIARTNEISPAQFDTTQSQRYSPTIANLPPLGADDVNTWVAYWRKKGFLPA